MSIIQIVDNEIATNIPIGASIVFENKIARRFNPVTDNVTNIVGVSFSKNAMYGREVVNGLVFYENDTYKMDPFFNYETDEYGYPVPNPKDPLVNPWECEECVFILTHGTVPILKGEPTHPSWICYDTEFSDVTDIWWIR